MTFLLAAFCVMPTWAQEVGQKTFGTAKEAAQALINAVSSGDQAELLSVVGKGSQAILTSGDSEVDAADKEEFLRASKEKLHLLPLEDDLTMLVVGRENFPFPLPLLKVNNVWHFDAKLGLEEVRARRIGENELNAIRACEAYAQAQREYFNLDPDGAEIAEYADRIVSTSGKHDGLYWPPEPGQRLSPLGPLFAGASEPEAEGGKPFHGYYFRVLTGQGASAPGGAYSYLINSNMVAGFALVAYPADYGESGIMTFLVGPTGTDYEKDFTEATAETGRSMKLFDPGPGWKHI